MTDLEQRIKEAAEKATQGEWELHSSNSWWRIGTTEKDGSIVRPTNHLLDDHPDLAAREADLEWIALASPANILALLAEKDAEIERLTEELQAIDAVLARRPALADLDNRYSKVERACRIAGNAESAERERDEWKRKCEKVVAWDDGDLAELPFAEIVGPIREALKGE